MSGELFVLARISALNRRARPLPARTKPPAHRAGEPVRAWSHGELIGCGEQPDVPDRVMRMRSDQHADSHGMLELCDASARS
jgi:hypothetical protein